MKRCPYDDCTFTGSDDEVDDHRSTGVHNDQPQAGSNLAERQRDARAASIFFDPQIVESLR